MVVDGRNQPFLSVKTFVCPWTKKTSFNNNEDDSTDDSNIMLEYEPLAIQESVHFYLESEFHSTESSSLLTAQSSFGFVTGMHNTTDEIENNEALQKEFDDVRCASQRLFVEHGSPRSIDTSSDEDRKSVKRKRDKGSSCECKTDEHQLTLEDIYTQDKYPSNFSNSHSPVTTNRRKQVKILGTSFKSHKSSDIDKKCKNFALNTIPKVFNDLTPFKDCITENSVVNILFLVTQVNETRDVKIKSGTNAGSFVAVSSLLIADESKSAFKLTLWREASSWTDKICIGDFAVATGVKVGKWREEFVGQTTFKSSFFNLHQPETILSNACLRLVSQERFNSIFRWARSEHPYFFAVSRVTRTVEFTEMARLRDNTLVHFRGKVMSVHGTSASSTYRFGDQQLSKITVVLAERPGDMIKLFLWGRQAKWMNQIQEGLGRVWEFKYVTAKYSTDTGCVSLHTTPRSTKTKLVAEDKNARLIVPRFEYNAHQRRKFSNLSDLLGSKYIGLAEVDAGITSLQFHCESDKTIIVDQTESAINQLKGKIDKLVYIGCGSCSRALVQDHNGVYGQCVYCVVANPGYQYAIDYYYKPLTIFVNDSCVALHVEAFSRVVSRLFEQFPAKSLAQKPVNASSHDSEFEDSFIGYLKEIGRAHV